MRFFKNFFASSTIYEKFHEIPHEDFIKLIHRSLYKQKIKNVKFPKFPEPQIQVNMIGTSGEAALHEPKNFYLQIHDVAKKTNLTFSKDTKILDFGCGYGRMYRFFMKDVPPGNLIGTDVTTSFYQICLDTFPPKESVFMVNEPFPPLSFDNSTFDIIYLYSIFSHLSEDCFTAWLDEFYRICKPGGLIIFTVRQQSFLTDMQHMDLKQYNSSYLETLYNQFSSPEIQKQYDNGDFIFFPNGGGEQMKTTFYGDTVIPPIYLTNFINNSFGRFEVVSSFDAPAILPQAFVALTTNK